MPTAHTLTACDVSYAGKALHPGYGSRRGVPMSHLLVKDYGVLSQALAEVLIKDATGAEMPNAATITYSPSTDGTSPLDATTRPTIVTKNVGGVPTLVWNLGAPRNIVSVVTHATAVVACSILYSGFDEFMEPVTELHTITAGTTSKTVTGKKALHYLASIAITAAGNATANTLDVGTGVIFGLPVKVTSKNAVLGVRMDGAADATPTVVLADTTDPATNITGDVRGTIDFTSDPDGTRTYLVMLLVADRSSKKAAFGVTQA